MSLPQNLSTNLNAENHTFWISILIPLMFDTAIQHLFQEIQAKNQAEIFYYWPQTNLWDGFEAMITFEY